MYNEIIVTDTREELIQYPNQQWKHIILHTVLNQTLFGYIPLHWHKALQFIFVIKGQLEIVISENIETVNQGEGLFINSNTVHEITGKLPDTAFYCWNIELPDASNYMEYNYVTHIVNNADKSPYLKLSQQDDIQIEILRLIDEAGKCYEEKSNDYMIDITINYYKILKYINRIMDNQVTTITYHFDIRVKQLIEYIQYNATTKLSLSDLSTIIHMSESETIKIFKQYMHQTPFQYVLNYRLEQSIDMLFSYKNHSVTEVAMACGFSTTSYYIKLFKEKYGETPKQYQKRLQAINA
ncbi:AraC family transcriptional regulator [Staphylococcus sp. ACRSN]|uniref:AraC family transcriptional regulator n=1 Tax=Staphylococcus sp. ACRSN TaxID=2918214 RepID=UPI001EF20C6F|nr:AraC family transcriptional regulator [Staphylococcus sp. ACRSN]MCG7338011.1 AraC family transcriptional regulator [Staphylococcus sp. ACRSN]